MSSEPAPEGTAPTRRDQPVSVTTHDASTGPTGSTGSTTAGHDASAGSDDSLTGATPRDLSVNALILGFAAMAWCGWGQSNPPRWATPILVAGSVLGLLLAITGIIAVRRHRHASSRMDTKEAMRSYFVVVGIEVACCVAGPVILGATGHSDYIAAWVLLVVGVHFVPLARLMRITALAATGVLVVLAAVTAFILGALGAADPTFAAGGLGGALLLLGGATTMAQGRSLAGRVGWYARVENTRIPR